ncbi:hypothetical protein JHK82_036988 [Glycine max]|nr:hypothetical protein JHK82_036988 [Glycine max]KAG5130997.1 hypothetical protein JHK84_037394 [Glycine max]
MVIASIVSNLISNIAEYDVFSERNNVYLAMADSCQKLSIMIHDHEFSFAGDSHHHHADDLPSVDGDSDDVFAWRPSPLRNTVDRAEAKHLIHLRTTVEESVVRDHQVLSFKVPNWREAYTFRHDACGDSTCIPVVQELIKKVTGMHPSLTKWRLG